MTYYKRHIHDEIRDHLKSKENTIIVGARQVGKTVLIRELYKELKNEGHKVFYLTFENIDILREVNNHPENVFKFTDRPINPFDKDAEAKDRIYLFIDEVQYADNPSGFLKYLFDTYLGNLKIIATGSSAFYIDSKFKDSLAGRKRIFILNRLNILEFVEFKQKPELSDEIIKGRTRKEYISLKSGEITNLFDEFLIYGGYPAVVLETRVDYKKQVLFEIRDSWLKRDILEADVRNEIEFFNLMTVLADQAGNLLNKNELSNTLGLHANTLTNYINILMKCFHIDLIRPFHKNIRKEITKMPKVYFQDMGLRNALINRFSPLRERSEKGALLENYVFLRLKEIYNHEFIRFWRTSEGHEIDFVITPDFNTGEAFEVKFGKFDGTKYQYKKFAKNYPAMDIKGINYEEAVYL